MPCPHRSDDASTSGSTPDDTPSDGGRRQFLKAALAVGGTGALSACLEQVGEPAVSRGPDDPESLPERQFAWNDFLPRDAHRNTVLPTHQLVLLLEYADGGPPTTAEREQVERAFTSVERACQRGNGGVNPFGSEADSDGLLFSVGYSRRYFDRFDEPLHDSVDLPRSRAVIDELGENATPDEADATVVLTSDRPQVLLSVESALFGDLGSVNGVAIEDSLVGVLKRVDRRTGFIGTNLPHRRLGVEAIPERSPQAMGYKSGFRGNQATEDDVAIGDGPFADGTTQHLSRLTFDLESWYENDDAERVDMMFSPHHTTEQVGEIGEFLAGDSGVTRDIAERAIEDARENGVVGHTQKLAMARDEGFNPRILRRSEAISTGSNGPTMNFSSVQSTITDFVETRRAMNGNLADREISCPHSGILDFITVTRRGNYLVPPRSLRSLPTPNPGDGDGD